MNLKNNLINEELLLMKMPANIRRDCVKLKLPPKTILVKKDEEPKYVYILCSGKLRIYNEFENGKILETAKVKDMDFIGVIEVLSGKEKIAATVETEIECVALRLHNEDFIKWMNMDHEFAIIILRKMAGHFYDVTYSKGKLLLNSTMYTIVSYIIDNIKDQLKEAEISIISKKRQEIADELGISLRTVQRNVKKLRDSELINIKTGKIHVSKNQYKLLKNKLNELI